MKFIIDDKEITANEGDSILEAALRQGVYIPHLCHHPDLEAKGGCRLCSVEIEGKEEVVPSCMTRVEPDMVVNLRSPRAEETRKMAMELILATHPPDCTGCPKYGKCELQSMYQYMGVSPEGWRKKSQSVPNDESNPLIQHLFTRCVRCGRCIRACRDLRGVGVLDYIKTDQGVRAGIRDETSLEAAGCRFCGTCIEVCPTGSIMDAVGIIKEDASYTDSVIPCRAACPAYADIPRYLRYIREGDMQKAVAVMRETLPFPATLGSICDHKCESACKRNHLGQPLSICKLKQSAALKDKGLWKERARHGNDTGKKVAVIGAGPAGLTAAYYLKKNGHSVTLFEKNEKPGGQCRYGIPAYRLPEEILEKEIADILETGVELTTGVSVEKPAVLLDQGYDAVLVSIGTHKGTVLPIEGHDLEGVLANADFLKNARMKTAGMPGERVMVLGGGNVAYDCARTALRLGSKEVHIACLENDQQMTASEAEREEGWDEGIILHSAHSFLRIVGREKVEGVELQKVDKFFFDSDHCPVIELVEGTNEIIPVDTVIFAVGQTPEGTKDMDLELTHGPYIKVNGEMETSLPGVFAAGDVVSGTKSVVEAIAAARHVAGEMDRFLGGDGDISEVLLDPEPQNPYIGPMEGFSELERLMPDQTEPDERKSHFKLVDQPFDPDGARAEANRCLRCDLRLELKRAKLWNEY